MNWTEEQLKGIHERGGRIIVSASAGSGKTAVLSERILKYIESGGTISNLLVVTFTNLAASEMKSRINKKIIKLSNNDESYYQELLKINNAEITTMDAFFGNLVRQNFHLLNIKPDFTIINDIEFINTKNQIITSLINKYLEKDDSIKPLLNNFANPKSGTTIEEFIIKLSEFLLKQPFPKDYVNYLLLEYQKDLSDSIWLNILYEDLNIKLINILNNYKEYKETVESDEELFNKINDLLTSEINEISNLLNSVLKKEYVSLFDIINKITFKNFPSIKGRTTEDIILNIKNTRETYKNTVKEYQEILITEDDYKKEQEELYKLIKIATTITLEYIELLEKEKTKENKYTFTDIPQFASRLLLKKYDFKNNEFIKTDLANNISYDEILIDEYQDTSMLQDLIFRSISNNEENLFMVGDIKQSIYSFRSARPDIFNNITKSSNKDKFPKKLLLSKNFRSRETVLNFTNYIYDTIMTERISEIDYKDNHALIAGANYQAAKTETEFTLLDGDLLRTKALDLEARYTALKIKELLDNKFQVADKETSKDLEPGDIAILLRNKSSIKHFRKHLVNLGINTYADEELVYFDSYEIKLMISLLKSINNIHDNISIISVIHSVIFNLDNKFLFDIRKDLDISIYNNLIYDNSNESKQIINTLEDFKNYAKTNTLTDLINYIYIKTDLIFKLREKDFFETRVKNLMTLLEYAEDFMNNYEDNLNGFVNYIEDLINNDESLGGINPVNEGKSVLITTIHKSKGLEFPVVFMPSLDTSFSAASSKTNYLLNDDYFINIKLRDYSDYSVKNTLNLQLVQKHINKKQLAEEIRILYVGLTRAKEKLFLSGFVKDREKYTTKISSKIGHDKINELAILEARSYLDLIYPSLIKSSSGTELRTLTSLSHKVVNTEPIVINIVNETEVPLINTEKINLKEEVIKTDKLLVLDKPEKIPSSSSVTSSNKNIIPPKFVRGIGTEIGNMYHSYLEHIPFIKYTENSFSNLDIEKRYQDKLSNFFLSDFYKNKIIISDYKKEYKVNYLKDNTLIEGIIDLLCITNKEVYIIDYKSDVATKEQLLKQYSKQLNTYEKQIKPVFKDKQIIKYIYSLNLGIFIEV